MSHTVVFRRDAGNYYIFAQYSLPKAPPADTSVITNYQVDIWDPVAETYIAQNITLTYQSAVRGFLSGARAKSELDSKEFIVLVHRPMSNNQDVQSFSRFVHVADILKRQQELQTDFDSFEVVNQNEHDATQTSLSDLEVANQGRHTDLINEHNSTQSSIATIAGAAEGYFTGAPFMSVPASGTKTYKLKFLLRDLDMSPVTLVDPDNNRVTVTVLDTQTATAPNGITLSDSDAGTAGYQMTRLSQGSYEIDVTVSSTAIEDSCIIFEATYTRSGSPNTLIFIANLTDYNDQLGRIESTVTATEAAVTSMHNSLISEHDATQALLSNATYGLSALQTLLDGIDTSGELAARFTEIKGAGWTNQTLKAIKDVIDIINSEIATSPHSETPDGEPARTP